jgi:hypothetical protein
VTEQQRDDKQQKWSGRDCELDHRSDKLTHNLRPR